MILSDQPFGRGAKIALLALFVFIVMMRLPQIGDRRSAEPCGSARRRNAPVAAASFRIPGE